MTLAVLILALLCAPATAEMRRVRLDDIPAPARAWLGDHAASPEAFDRWIRELSNSFEQRLREGHFDHLILSILQSREFTPLPPVDPAQSARQYHESGEQIPASARARIEAFLPTTTETRDTLEREYRRAMRFLYRRELEARRLEGAERRRAVAGTYQQRGLSSDTNVASSFGVFVGLHAIRKLDSGAKLERALVIGPGLDLKETQSLQPYLLADSLLRAGLAKPETLEVRCLDVNAQVVRHLNSFAEGSRILSLSWQPDEVEQRDFLDLAGASIGRVTRRRVEVRPDIARRISAAVMNIVTERITGEPAFDIAVATNVLLYFNAQELLLALSNIRSMLRSGGYLLHNDLRQEVAEYGRALGLPLIHARMVRLERSPSRELHDGVIIHKVE